MMAQRLLAVYGYRNTTLLEGHMAGWKEMPYLWNSRDLACALERCRPDCSYSRRCESGIREAEIASVMRIVMHAQLKFLLPLLEAFFNATQN